MLKGLLDRFKVWREKKAWLKYADFQSLQCQLQLLEFQVWQSRQEQEHQRERRKLMKKIDKAKQNYIA